MKILLAGAVAALALVGATVATTESAQAFVHFGISLHEGDVRFAYRDGYWDRWHRWHAWEDRDDWRWWRAHHPDAYYDWRHDRDADMGWRDGGGMMMGGPGVGVHIGGRGFGVTVGVPVFEVGVGDIAYGYADGYWDRWHRWHVWHNDAERVYWRDHYHDRYWDWHHDRDHDMGWRHDWH
jgi:hypothetical protein